MSDKIMLNFGDKLQIEVDEEERPQLANYLKNQSDGENLSSYDLACMLQKFDRDKDLPREIFDLIVSEYKLEIEKGNDEAMLNLGALYYIGHGCEQDFTKAVYYYKMASKFGNRQAQENLGYCYYYGRSVRVDYEKAFHYFALGAFEGRAVSLYKIGDMYKNGYYVEKNLKEAFRLYERAYYEGDEESYGPICLRLGDAYLNGEGVGPDYRKALEYYQQAEIYLYDMIKNGDYMYTNSLKAAVDNQDIARIRLSTLLDVREWTFE